MQYQIKSRKVGQYHIKSRKVNHAIPNKIKKSWPCNTKQNQEKLTNTKVCIIFFIICDYNRHNGSECVHEIKQASNLLPLFINHTMLITMHLFVVSLTSHILKGVNVTSFLQTEIAYFLFSLLSTSFCI